MRRFLDKPSPEYLEAVERLRRLAPELAERAFAEAVADRWREAATAKWRPSRTWDVENFLLFRRQRDMWPTSGWRDHVTCWRDPIDGSRIVVSQPYQIGSEAMRELVALADLGVDVCIHGGSWHFPGATVRIDLKAAPRHDTPERQSRP